MYPCKWEFVNVCKHTLCMFCSHWADLSTGRIPCAQTARHVDKYYAEILRVTCPIHTSSSSWLWWSRAVQLCAKWGLDLSTACTCLPSRQTRHHQADWPSGTFTKNLLVWERLDLWNIKEYIELCEYKYFQILLQKSLEYWWKRSRGRFWALCRLLRSAHSTFPAQEHLGWWWWCSCYVAPDMYFFANGSTYNMTFVQLYNCIALQQIATVLI